VSRQANINYEEHVLASLLSGDMVAYSAIADIIKPEFFENHYCRYIYAAIQKIHNATQEPVDYVSVMENALADNRLSEHQAREIGLAVNILMNQRFINLPNYKYYVTKFMEQVKRKELNLLGKVITAADLNNITEYIETVKIQLNHIQQKNIVQTLSTAGECALEAIDGIVNFNPANIINTGFTIDYLMGGMRKKQLIILAARPRMGKSAFALTLTYKLAKQGKKVIYYSMEMGKADLFNRITAINTHVDLENILNPDRLSDYEIMQITKEQNDLSTLPILIHDNGKCSPMKVEADINKQALIGQKPDIVIIDGIELVQGDRPKYNSDFERISDISRSLKCLAMNSNIPVLVVSQVNRNCDDRKNKRPELHDLRMTGNLEQDADIVIMLYRDEVYNDKTEEPGIAEVFIRKNRNGKDGMRKMFFKAQFTEFTNLDRE
jgi:replicative DNA helicase